MYVCRSVINDLLYIIYTFVRLIFGYTYVCIFGLLWYTVVRNVARDNI